MLGAERKIRREEKEIKWQVKGCKKTLEKKDQIVLSAFRFFPYISHNTLLTHPAMSGSQLAPGPVLC